MEQIFKILLTLHVVGGSVSLLLGSYIMTTKKGDARHKLLGNIFFWAMLMAALVALPMSYLHAKYFLFIVGVFTTYMLLSGKRYLKIKSIDDVKTTDWLTTGIMGVFGVAFMVFGIWHIVQANTFGFVFLAFGAVSLRFTYMDKINYSGQSSVKNFGLLAHLQRMIGAYIASATAFLVVNNKILPNVVAWLLPIFILIPLIVKWSRQYAVRK